MQRRGPDPAISQSEAFELLGNETRLAIIQELARHRRTNWQWSGLTFAELRKAVGVRDAGTFNYHLDELREQFVVKDGDEYVLNQQGLSVADAVLAGRYGEQSVERRGSTELDCLRCGSVLDTVYEDGTIRLACDEHGIVVATSLPPSAVVDRSMDEVVDLAFLDMQQDVERSMAGACMHCWGRMHGGLSFEPPVEHPATGDPVDATSPRAEGPTAAFGCERCGMVFWTEPYGAVLSESPVVAFFDAHGIDVRGLPFVDDRLVEAFEEQSVREDGRLALTLALDGDRLILTLDRELDVVHVKGSTDADGPASGGAQ